MKDLTYHFRSLGLLPWPLILGVNRQSWPSDLQSSPFGVVSGFGLGMGVLDGVEIVEEEGQFWR